MLVLTRKNGERVMIGSDVEVVVVGVSRGKVRLGVVAPDDIPIHRAEVLRRTHDVQPAYKNDHPQPRRRTA